MDERIHNVPVKDVQADEIWTFVGKKERYRVYGDKNFEEIGDAWVFIGIERNSKLVLAHEVGRRTAAITLRFMQKLAYATDPNQRFQLTTDGLRHYHYAVGILMHDRVDYAELVKIYEDVAPEEARRYSPPRHVAETHKTDVYGDPDFDLICTSHVERQNGSLRQWCKRLTRRTYAFSKKPANLKAAMALHFAYYNFCRVHRSLKATPAIAAGLTDRVWTMADLLA